MSGLPDDTLDHLRDVLVRPEIPGDRYEVREAIARGGMGAVWRARDRTLERDVALKVLDVPELSEGARERMLREARILASLEHPSIVPIHDLGTLGDGRTWYTMKLVEGDRLDAHLRDIPELPRRLAIFERICEAVAFAHAHGVIHRDLKPENVMVGPFGEVLVMDWGVAKIRGDTGRAAPDQAGRSEHVPPSPDEPTAAMTPNADTRPGTVLGTPGYMAPEQAAGDAHRVDERSDVYALGMLLAAVAAADDRPVPRRLGAIGTRAAARDAADRYPDVPALLADVRRFQAGQPVSAYRDTPWERAARLVTRHRTAILLVGVYVVVRGLMLLFART